MGGFFQKVGGVVKSVGSALLPQSKAGKIALSVAFMMVACAMPSYATGVTPAVTIPVIGVSVQDYISAAITLMGTVAATAVGGYAAFLVVRKSLRWLGKALG